MKNNSKNSKKFVRHLQNPLVFFFIYRLLQLYWTFDHVGSKKTAQFRKDVKNKICDRPEIIFFLCGCLSDVHVLWKESWTGLPQKQNCQLNRSTCHS